MPARRVSGATGGTAKQGIIARLLGGGIDRGLVLEDAQVCVVGPRLEQRRYCVGSREPFHVAQSVRGSKP
jgi:hypothetical protein